MACGKRKGKVEYSLLQKKTELHICRERKHAQKRTFISVTNVQSKLDSEQSPASFRLGNNMVRECEKAQQQQQQHKKQ